MIIHRILSWLKAFWLATFTSQAQDSNKFMIVNLEPSSEDLPILLKNEVKKANTLKLKPFVEFYADWCGPCKALRDSFSNSLMADALKGAYIIQLNADKWKNKLSGTGFSVRVIPVFFRLDDGGKPTGDTIDGDAWGANTPPSMAPPLKAFFRK